MRVFNDTYPVRVSSNIPSSIPIENDLTIKNGELYIAFDSLNIKGNLVIETNGGLRIV